ncbi:hypothetical protein BD410DRAFT_803896 [Rickenella mellea]|uniref:Uncharacterized protein n=1 Tax=Rickenella mellea TaxID=50990 RepID=A0A4Y7Q389_9AGAM|nr:hypothetical protein BD410DRAFT_803896 [Rickenella mellea]
MDSTHTRTWNEPQIAQFREYARLSFLGVDSVPPPDGYEDWRRATMFNDLHKALPFGGPDDSHMDTSECSASERSVSIEPDDVGIDPKSLTISPSTSKGGPTNGSAAVKTQANGPSKSSALSKAEALRPPVMKRLPPPADTTNSGSATSANVTTVPSTAVANTNFATQPIEPDFFPAMLHPSPFSLDIAFAGDVGTSLTSQILLNEVNRAHRMYEALSMRFIDTLLTPSRDTPSQVPARISEPRADLRASHVAENGSSREPNVRPPNVHNGRPNTTTNGRASSSNMQNGRMHNGNNFTNGRSSNGGPSTFNANNNRWRSPSFQGQV